MQWVTCALLYF